MSTKDKINFVYDLETSGIGKKFLDKPFDNVAWEQIYQFGYIMTDENFDTVLNKGNLFARPRTSTIPLIGAILTTKKTMFELYQSNLSHFELIQKVFKIISEAQNKFKVNFLGHNILKYDEHVLSSCLHNSGFFPFLTKMSNSTRGDSIKMISLAASLDSSVIQKGINDKGNHSFALGALASANNIEMSNAHDAICDVETTISLLKKINHNNPSLYSKISNINNSEYISNLIKSESFFLMKLANNSKFFKPFLFLGMDANDPKRAYGYDLSSVSNFEEIKDIQQIKTFKIDNSPMIVKFDKKLDIQSHIPINEIELLCSKAKTKIDMDKLIYEKRSSFDSEIVEILDPEEKLFENKNLHQTDLYNANLEKLSLIASETKNPNSTFLLKKIIFDENPALLNKSDRQEIYEIVRERLLTEGFTYFTNLKEAKDNLVFEKKQRLNESNEDIFQSYEYYLEHLTEYFESPTINNANKFNLIG